MTAQRTKRSVQIPLLKAAILALAEREGETVMSSNFPVTEVKLPSLYFWLTPFGGLGTFTNVDVWDENSGGNKVLNMCWGPDGAIEVVSFRRGEWENILLAKARARLH